MINCIQAGADSVRICSYHSSLPLFRNQLAFAVTHLIAQITQIPHSPLTPIPHIQTTLRLAYERLGGGQPSQWPSGVPIPVMGTLLAEVVETGNVAAVGKRGIIGKEIGRDLWKKVIGGN